MLRWEDERLWTGSLGGLSETSRNLSVRLRLIALGRVQGDPGDGTGAQGKLLHDTCP